MPIESLRGLKGLSGLSQQERDAWRRINASKLEGKSAQYEDRLYANQQFVKNLEWMLSSLIIRTKEIIYIKMH